MEYPEAAVANHKFARRIFIPTPGVISMHQRTKVCHGVALALATLLAGSAGAQDVTDVQRVEVTGSAIKRINVEGALPIQTLTQDDIKKSGVTTVTDLIQILLGAVDHVDVLTDGASALYGADAIAGVVNIVTKRDGTDGAIDLSLDHPFKKGGQSASASISKGFGDLSKDNFNVFLAATFDHQSALKASQRSFSKNGGLLNFNDA